MIANTRLLIATSALGLAVVCLAVPARATLGSAPSSQVLVHAGSHLTTKAVRKAETASAVQTKSIYQVNEASADGVTVREYSVDNTVFAVTWKGLDQPDLGALLGTRFQEFEAQTNARKPTRSRQLAISGGDFKVVITGLTPDLHGRAWVPTLVPSGVDPGDLP